MNDEIAERTLDMVESFAVKLESLAVEIGPEVGELTLTAARVDAINEIFPAVLFAGLGTLLIYFLLRRIQKYYKKERPSDAEDIGAVLSGVCAALLAIPTIVYTESWLSIWPWVGLYEPKLWIAYKLLGL